MTALETSSNEETAMKPSLRYQFTGITAFAIACMPLQLGAQRPQHRSFAHYDVIDLGTLGGTYSFGFGLNSRGAVAGGAATAIQTGDPNSTNPQPPQTAFLWQRGQMINLGTLGTSGLNLNSSGGGANRFNEVTLVSETPNMDPNGEDFCYFGTFRQCVGATWINGRLTPLPNTLGGNNSNVFGLNDSGQIVGFAETAVYDASCSTPGKPFQHYRFDAAIWEPNGKLRPLKPYPGDTVSFGFGINNLGQAVGGSGLCSKTDLPPNPMGMRSVLWEKDGTPIDLGGLGGALSLPSAITDRGDVDGAATDQNGNLRPYLWTKEWGKPHNLGALHPDDPVVVAPCCNTVNLSRQVVGFDLDSNFNSRAFLWQNGVMVDLNDLIAADSPWVLESALAINDAGQITGYGIINGLTHAFLATPCHEHDGRKCCEAHNK
jgi:probable HAF family extracellular repeat protein